jgi:hypothetical protein
MARPGLELVEKVMRIDERASDFNPELYAITTKQEVLLAVNDVLERYMEEDGGKAPSVNEVAIAIPFTSASLERLTGSGLMLAENTNFAYRAGRDDVRTQWMYGVKGVSITISDLDTIAVAEDDTWIDDFLKQYGVGTGAIDADITVPRTTPAVTQQHAVASTKTKGRTQKAALHRLASLNPIDNFLS